MCVYIYIYIYIYIYMYIYIYNIYNSNITLILAQNLYYCNNYNNYNNNYIG